MQKKGLELSINFIVMLILAIVIFSFGLVFVAKILSETDRQIGLLPEAEELALDACLNEQNLVCLPNNKKELEPGKSHVFGLAVQNYAGESKEFSVLVELSLAIDNEGNEITPIDAAEWTFQSHEPFMLANNEQMKLTIPFTIPIHAEQGEYAFNVNVCFKDDTHPDDAEKCPDAAYPDLYDTTHKIRIMVI
ncbi:hypothetical protein JW930_05450 [Candidatus Woesearchaeota archaeon]|nr:hypothetical protein [Candidatus Woesearchaeota archaeon]